jgi:hypothetical protein
MWPGGLCDTAKLSSAPCKAGIASAIFDREPFPLFFIIRRLFFLPHCTNSFQMLQIYLVEKVLIKFTLLALFFMPLLIQEQEGR